MSQNIPAPTGRRSPKWAIWKRMTIPCQNKKGEAVPYLARLRIVQTPWFGVYLHDIYEPDGDRHPHDHPWTFWSFILRGGYTERFHPYPHVHPNLCVREQSWKRFSIHKMKRDTAHRIVDAAPGLKTLIITGPRRGNWGFYTEQGWMQWQEYEKKYRLPPVK